jgi:hypothetical protein
MQIEELQIKLVHVATTLKIHQNASCPINILPPEILVEIFHQAYPLPTDFPPSLEDYPQADDLVRITHICSHWRQTALASPVVCRCLTSVLTDGIHPSLWAFRI